MQESLLTQFLICSHLSQRGHELMAKAVEHLFR